MRQYVIDELHHNEVEKIREYLEEKCDKSGLGNIFWLNIPDDHLTDEQRGHESCSPHVAGIEVMENAVAFEMLIRSRNKMRCSCIGFATSEQRDYILNFVDLMISETGLNI
jgi:hypothetical protein